MPVKFLTGGKPPDKKRRNTSAKSHPDPADIPAIVEAQKKVLREMVAKGLTPTGRVPGEPQTQSLPPRTAEGKRIIEAFKQEVVDTATGEVLKVVVTKDKLGPVRPDFMDEPYPPIKFDSSKDPVKVLAEKDRIIAHFRKCLEKYPEAHMVYQRCIDAEVAMKASYLEFRAQIDAKAKA